MQKVTECTFRLTLSVLLRQYVNMCSLLQVYFQMAYVINTRSPLPEANALLASVVART